MAKTNRALRVRFNQILNELAVWNNLLEPSSTGDNHHHLLLLNDTKVKLAERKNEF